MAIKSYQELHIPYSRHLNKNLPPHASIPKYTGLHEHNERKYCTIFSIGNAQIIKRKLEVYSGNVLKVYQNRTFKASTAYFLSTNYLVSSFFLSLEHYNVTDTNLRWLAPLLNVYTVP